MSASTTGNVTEEHHNFISIMAIERQKRSARSGIINKPCSQKSATGSIYKRSGEQQHFVSCRQLHLCGGPGGDSENGRITEKLEKAEPCSKSKGTQTDYRESEAQTSPWEAPYKLTLRANENPEVLRLAKSTWGNGLPASIHEVQIIQRMRIKRAWLEALPLMDCPENIKIRETITANIEANKWAFREEIQSIMDARMELMGRIRKQKRKEKEEMTGNRIERHAKNLGHLRTMQIHSIRANVLRAIRKLTMKHRVSTAAPKKSRSDLFERHASAKSDLYGTGIRFNGKTMKPHKILTKALWIGESCLNGTAEMKDSTKSLPLHQPSVGTRRDSKLCPRQTTWNDEKLKKLHADLKAIRLNRNNERNHVPTLLKRKLKAPTLPATPTTNRNTQTDNYWENSSLFLQKITRGRAIQTMMCEGRNRCRELIQELQSKIKQGSTQSWCHDGKMDKFPRGSEENDTELQDNRLCEVFDSLEGKTVAEMLDMLSKEDTRLREERRAHGFALLVERERNRREAEESGRRQLERNRRREMDEMFRQIVKVNQDSVEAYLEDIIKEGIDWVSDEQARRYVIELADNIDASTTQSLVHDDPAKDKELIADMVQKLLLPEVDKKILRRTIQSKQPGYISDARIAIYNEIIKSTGKVDISTDELETKNELLSEKEESSSFEIPSID